MRFQTETELWTNAKVSLSAWWCLSCNGSSPSEADSQYDRIVNHGWGEHDEGVSQMLNRAFGQTGLIPRAILAPILAEFPFRVMIDGLERAPMTMRIENGEVHAI